MPDKLFIDTNVYLDVLMERGKDWESAKAVLKLAEKGRVEAYTSSSSLINLMYIMGACKVPKEEILVQASAILSYTSLINPDNMIFNAALTSGFKDVEDAVQYHTALQVKGMKCFITSNLKDYKNISGLLPVVTPRQFMDRYNKS